MPKDLLDIIVTGDKAAALALPPEQKTQLLEMARAMRANPAKVAADYSVPQTVGGLVGGSVGGVPGAMGGAAIADLVTKLLQGETDPVSLGLSATGQGLLEGIIPGIGKVLKGLGRSAVRSALPISEKAASLVGGGPDMMPEGVTKIVNEAISRPGATIENTRSVLKSSLEDLYKLDENIVQQATQQGRTVNLDPIIEQNLKRAGRHSALPESVRFGELQTLQDFWDRYQPPGSRGVLDPETARAILKGTKFKEDVGSVPGAAGMVSDIRKAVSHQLRQDIPELTPVLAEESLLKSLGPILSKAEAAPTRTPAPEIIFSGGRPKLFGIIPSSPRLAFSGGKQAARSGANLEQNRLGPGALRALFDSILNADENR